MIQICRAEDGFVSQVNGTLWDIERIGSLEYFLQEETGVSEDSILAYLSDGRRLRNENVRDLAGVQDQTIYVFNKTYLDIDLDQVLQRIRVEAPLQPPIEETISATPPFRTSQLASSYLRTAQIHSSEIDRTLQSLRYQNEALRIASSALDHNVLSISDAFESISSNTQRELEKQASLLSGLEADLEIVSRVAIHKEFMSVSVRKALEMGERGRTLGDYVSKSKMGQVAETCARTHDDLRDRFEQAKEAMSRLRQGTDDVRTVVSDGGPQEDASVCSRRSQESTGRMSELATIVERPNSDGDKIVQEIRHLDGVIRNELQRITQIKNSYSERCISVLREISVLNNSLVILPNALASLQSSLKAKTSFSHIQRLHNMLYAYGATVVEIVRRKEFSQFFYQRAQSILEIMAKLSANERKRRQLYRGEVHGQLPFETKGMEDPVPTINFTVSPSSIDSGESPYSLERSDVDALLRVLDDLERFARESPDPAALASVREARIGLEKLVGKMDSLEVGFERIAERNLLSSSRLFNHRRRSADIGDQACAALESQLIELQQAKTEQESTFHTDRQSLESEISRLRTQLDETESVRDTLERDLHSTKAQLESDTSSRRILEKRNSELSSAADNRRSSLATALAEATDRTKEAEVLRQELAQVRAEYDDVKALEARHAEKMDGLLEEQANALRRLEEARSRGEDLEAQIQAARTESDEVKRALAESGKEKDRLLKAQASEHDRMMRDHIAEADGDRAVLEHQYLEMKATLEDIESQLKGARAEAEMVSSDAVGLRAELQRVEHELREARHVERVLREDLSAGRASQSDYELRLENSSRLIAQIMDVALRFRESHVKALMAAQQMASHPHPGSSKVPNGPATSSSMTESAFVGGSRLGRGLNHVALLEEPSPIDPSDPDGALEALRAFDHDQFLEAINKTGSTIRKWQKQCKEYRERSKGKISFRNFAKGDLALFLPTRNSVSKPWAAFNVSFPHYFLQATGHLAEQLKTREWIVARITSITERVVDHKDASTNPYGLGDGVKYYMLEVEDWTQPSHPSKRRVSNKKAISEVSALSATSVEVAPPAGPPEAEVEESFTVTRPPTSRLFPSPPRVNASPAAGPSSLSRLLAQAGSAENSAEPIAIAPSLSDKTPSPSPPPVPSPPPPHSSAQTASTSTAQVIRGHSTSTLRPGSRASRQSTSSRFSNARIPFAGSSGTAKAIATTAISEQVVPIPSSSAGSIPFRQSPSSTGSFSPSPDGSPTEGMSNILNSNRRRTASHHIPRNSPLASAFPSVSSNTNGVHSVADGPGVSGLPVNGTARSRLASLASSWGVSFSRRKLTEPPRPGSPDDPMRSPSGAVSGDEGSNR